MRKSTLFSAVLSLFLLVPASIISAQTVQISGTVTTEQDHRQVNFSSQQGNIRIILPGPLSGPGPGPVLLSGTVIREANGKTEREKQKNLETLQKANLDIAGFRIPFKENSQLFTYTVPGNTIQQLKITISPEKGSPATITLNSRVLPIKMVSEIAGSPSFYTEQKFFLTGSNIPVYSIGSFMPVENFFFTDAAGNTAEALKLASSPEQIILSLPSSIQPGPVTISRSSPNGKDHMKIRTASLNLSSSNTNLRKGETSSLMVTVDPQITHLDSADAMQIPIMQFNLRNMTPAIVEMQGGNMQVIQFEPKPGKLNVTRTITGVTPGTFNISASLYPSLTMGNPYRAQKEAIKTCEEFNKWAEGVKQDMQNFIRKLGSSYKDQELKDAAEKVINDLPACTDGNLDEFKLVADYLLRPIVLSGKKLQVEHSGINAFYAETGHLEHFADHFIHTDILRAGLENLKEFTKDTVTLKKIDDAIQASKNVDNDYSPSTLNALNKSIHDVGDQGMPVQFDQKELKEPRKLKDKALYIGLHVAIKKLIADAGGARGQTWNTVCDNCRGCIESRMGEWAADLVRDLGEGIIKEYLGKAVDLIAESYKAVKAAKEFFDKISDKAEKAENLAEDIADKIKKGELQVMDIEPKMCKDCLIKGTLFYNPKTGCVFAIIYCEGTKLCCPNVQTVVTLTYCTNEDGEPTQVPDIDVIKN